MSTLLAPTTHDEFLNLHQSSMPALTESHTSSSQLVQLLCGSGLLAYGLLRGSWLGLTLAAAGGFMLYRSLAPSLKPTDRRRLPPQGDARSDWSPAVILPPADEDAQTQQAHEEYADVVTAASPPSFLEAARSEVLTPEEHCQAEVAAYYHAVERGGGGLPVYEYDRAVEDFCRAAGTVLRQRLGG